MTTAYEKTVQAEMLDMAAKISRLEAVNAELLAALRDMYDSACTNATSTPSRSAFLKANAAISKSKATQL